MRTASSQVDAAVSEDALLVAWRGGTTWYTRRCLQQQAK